MLIELVVVLDAGREDGRCKWGYECVVKSLVMGVVVLLLKMEVARLDVVT
jgi:hypothetical protein